MIRELFDGFEGIFGGFWSFFGELIQAVKELIQRIKRFVLIIWEPIDGSVSLLGGSGTLVG